MKGQSFYKGSAILIIMVAVTKVMGVFYKLVLTDLLGGTGMAYYQSVYALFTPVYAVAVGGISSAVAVMTAENFALGRYKNARKIRRTALWFFSLTGLAASAVTALFSGKISYAMQGSDNLSAGLMAAAPALFLCCVISVYRGFSEGLCDMVPTAVSEIIETLFKLLLGLLLAFFVYERAGGSTKALPLTAAASVLGASLASLFACVYLYARLRVKGDGITPAMLSSDRCTDSSRYIIRQLMHFAMPIAFTAAIATLINTIDLLTVPAMLKFLQRRDMLDMSALEGSGVAFEDTADFIYGSFTALALTASGMIPGFTAMLGKPALPAVSKASAKGDREAVGRGVNDILLLSSLIAFPASFGMTVFARETLTFLFPSRVYETAVSAFPFAVLSAGLAFGCFLPPLFSLLQAVGRPGSCVKIMLLSCAVKLGGNLIFMRLPHMGVTGAALSLVLADAAAFFTALILLCKTALVKPDISRCFAAPAFAALLCAAGAKLCYDRLYTGILHEKLRVCLLISVFWGSIIYIFSLYLLNIMPKNFKIGQNFKKIAKRA